ncbi:glycosyltransferase family 57 protein [Aaosphaeria arxii CBS 175.79]|uniref:Glycosyltransferase family 57 protein n=1 Tax=Aaosphaeria arxii CBS 175.79 TaxID=1450172 RepID=A0A6A5XRQ2_9PLEO|nr:glycosyltransferase family 57 protein [Aaosphaeria arxii CBS 175.79]KAF2015517.1 glycosyltransferase family 57 protein [Aaosphaeria arxii CBS 175.79]
MSGVYPTIFQSAVVATALKVLLFPSYKSTDFEVHRNWLALTHSLPIKQWYYEKTSEWTLDYPPFFAYFEWILSQVAAYVEPALLNVKSLEYDSWQTIYFQRTTVILSELVLVYALHVYVKGAKSKTLAHAAALSILLSPGVLIIDHIHFQYNGFLFGILVLSLVLARNDSTLLLSGILFAALLCFKHIYLYLAPAYFVFLLRAYCLKTFSSFPYIGIRFFNCIKLAIGLFVTFASAFGPFVKWGQIEQLLSRLFPFSRGLCHAYWAPNIWAIYSFTDRVLIYLAPYLKLEVDPNAVHSVTRGLVGDSSFAVLPDITPLTCFLLTLGFQTPFLLRLLYKPTWETFVGAVTLCGYASFLFGWHVHEKAILIVIIPFSLIALRDRRYFGAFRPLAVAGHVSLFPLLFTAAEFPIKTVYTILWLILFLIAFDRLAPASPHPRIFLLDRFSLIYIALSIPLIAYCSLVQFKRKPVKLEPLPPSLNDQTEVWAIEETGEVFTEYDKFLARRDFYSQARPPDPTPEIFFTCESTGHTGYTYFEARESEVCKPHHVWDLMEASKEINSIFPEGLRSRVLEFVQFRNTARMDDLVNTVFDHFREHYMVGDRVSVEHENTKRYGVISQIVDQTSRIQSIYSSHAPDDQFRSLVYHITLDGSGEELIRYKAAELQRDRRVYSKLILKQFLRSAVSREAWNGAPWIVKDHLAKRYRISTTIPKAKTRDAVMAAKKAANSTNHHNALHHNGTGPLNGTALGNGQGALPPHHPAFLNFSINPQFPFHDPNPPALLPPQGHDNLYPRPYHGIPPHHQPPHPQIIPPGPKPEDMLPSNLPAFLTNALYLPIGRPFINGVMQTAQSEMQRIQQQEQEQQQSQSGQKAQQPRQRPTPPLAKPFEPIKYPMEDLKIKQPRTNISRPPLKFLCDDVPDGADPPKREKGVLMKSVGPILCAWETLNVHDGVYALDSFTIDDFVDAMCFTSEEVDCELLAEVHCAILNQLVDEEGELQVSIPSVPGADDSEDESSESESPEPEPEPEPPARSTRSSMRKSEANALAKQRTPTPEPEDLHRAPEFLEEFDWIERCKLRYFSEGGWQSILVGVLYALSFNSYQKETCEQILAELVPADEDPSIDNIALNYKHLDVNLRIAALEMVLQLTVTTETFREQLVAASQELTRLRKDKIENQKRRKELADELFKLDNERKIQLPLNVPTSPEVVKEDQDASFLSETKEDTDAGVESSPEQKSGNRKLRHTKQNKRKREADAIKKEKAKKAKIEAAKTKQQKEWDRLLKAIDKKKDDLKECEATINELDEDLRETMVHRCKLLGKDRFLNKYYWFEHNGMPYGGVPTSSTASYGYANGRLWVQGPDEYEFQPNLEEPALSQDKEEFGFTVPQRKEKEEGLTHLNASTEWGYYDEPEELDQLMAWLDERGIREKALRKELQICRDKIAEYMLKMNSHFAELEKAKTADEPVGTRVSKRAKGYSQAEATADRCLLWTNSIMRNEVGYSYMEEYEPPRKKRGSAKVTKAKGKK